jgi:hypothetical protein
MKEQERGDGADAVFSRHHAPHVPTRATTNGADFPARLARSG